MAHMRETAALWRRHAMRPDGETRAALLLAYWPLVKEVAASLRAKLPPHVDEGDMVSAGLFGLLSAIDRFDPADASRFAVFARARVHGAIIDDMRALDWAPRHVRERARELEEAACALEQRLQRRATSAEVAAAIGLTPDQVRVRLARNLLAQVAPLDADVAQTRGEGLRLVDTLEDRDAPDPAQSLAEEEVRAGVVQAITSLPWRERQLLVLHYRRGLTLRAIGRSLGVSESRVSQVHGQVVRRLRVEIHALLPSDAFPLRSVAEAAATALEALDEREGPAAATP